MLDKNQIIISHFKQGKSQRQISKEMGISRKTVKKYLSEFISCNQVGQSKEGVVTAPFYDTSKRFKRKLTNEVQQLIDECLLKNKEKQASGKAKQQMMANDIHDLLIEKGFEVGYTTVCNYVRKVKNKGGEIYIRQEYAPGHTIEFDWAEVKVNIDKVEKRLMLAVFTCAFSNYRWAFLFYRQDMASFLLSHVLFFEHIGYVPVEMLYDNMRVAVARFSYRPSEKQPTEALLKLSTYYQFRYRFCNVRRGNEKGHVERSVEYVRRKTFSSVDSFQTLEQANEHLHQICEKLNSLPSKGKQETIAGLFNQEKPHMRVVPPTYEVAEYVSLKIDKYHCISIDTNRYSVPESLTGPIVTVKIYPDKIFIYNERKIVTQHERRHSKYQWYIQIDHYLEQLKKKPGAITNSLALQQTNQWLKQLFVEHFQDRPRQFIELLQYQNQNNLEEPTFKQAIEKCIAISPNSPLELDKVRFVLQQGNKQKMACCKQEAAEDLLSQAILSNCLKQLGQQQKMYSQN